MDMGRMSGDVTLYGEARKQIRAVQIIVSDKASIQELDQVVEVNIKPHEIHLSKNDKIFAKFQFPPSISFILSSCPGVQWVPGDGFHLRIHLSAAGDDTNILNQTDDGTESFNIPEGVLMQLRCKSCKQELGSESFTKISELPSEDWQELMEGMWCCRNQDKAGPPKDLKFIPKRGECFQNDFAMVVSSEVLTDNRVDFTSLETKNNKPGKLIVCKRCQSLLGKANTQDNEGDLKSIHLWKYAVTLGYEKTSIEASLEMILSNYLAKLCKSQMCFKFVIESEEDHQPQLLLWLLSPDTILLKSGGVLHNEHEDEEAIPATSVHAETITKVLYQTCWNENGQKYSSEWNRDLMVQSISLPKQTCLDLAKCLIDSTRGTPISMKHMNDFMVGYLRRS